LINHSKKIANISATFLSSARPWTFDNIQSMATPCHKESPGKLALRVQDAILYLEQFVEFLQQQKPETFYKFINILISAETIDTPDLIKRVMDLFRGQRELISSFKKFLLDDKISNVDIERSKDDYRLSDKQIETYQASSPPSQPSMQNSPSELMAQEPDPSEVVTPPSVSSLSSSTSLRMTPGIVSKHFLDHPDLLQQFITLFLGDGAQIKIKHKHQPKEKVSPHRQSCDNCDSLSNGTIIYKACSRCKLVYYCSKECQTIHWKSTHKKTCIVLNDRKASNQIASDQKNEINQQLSGPSQESTSNLVCSICLDALTNATYTLPCSHTFHTNCIKSLRSHKGLNQVCPLCRTDLPPGPEEAFMKACCLFEKMNSDISSNSPESQDILDEMFSLMQCSAEEGFVLAQQCLGAMLLDDGAKQDYSKAFEWFLKAASQGHVQAQINVGHMFFRGQGMKQDFVKARHWYQKAQGHSQAQIQLGSIYREGKGVKQDHTKANDWFLKAASQGDAHAQGNLGRTYQLGIGVKQDSMKAFEWFLKAASQGHAQAQGSLGHMYQTGIGVKQDSKNARDWFLKAASQGEAYSQTQLGVMYCQGEGVKQDYTKSQQWFLKAASQGDAEAQLG